MKPHGPSEQSVDSPSTGTGRPSSSNGNAGGIFDGGLDTYKTVTEENYHSLFRSGLIVLDANILLNLYRYQADTRRALVEIFASLKDRLWVPHQAMFEFFENRTSVIASRSEEAEQAVEELQKKRQGIEDVVRQWANRVRLPKDNVERLLVTIRTAITDVVDGISRHSSDDSLEQAEDTAKDPVIASLNSVLQGSVGDPLPADELLAAKKEATRRKADKIPPGWRDANKRENPEGDYLIWYETLREARYRHTDVLFVTGDVKSDWWWKQKGEVRGPLPELVHETREIAGVRLFMLRPDSFIVHASTVLGIRVSNDSVNDARRVATELMQANSYVEDGTGRRYRRGDLTGPGERRTLSYDWHGVRPPQGRHWMYSEAKMDRMYAEDQIEFTNTGRPVRKRYLDQQS